MTGNERRSLSRVATLSATFAQDESHDENMSDAFVADFGRCNSIQEDYNTSVEASNDT